MGKEKNKYDMFKRHMTKIAPLDRIERIENVAGTGTPDVNYCINGVDGWIEFKAPILPVKIKTTRMFTGHNHMLSQAQKNWFLAQRNAGGRGWILVATGICWLLIDGTIHADAINEMTLNDAIDIASWHTPIPLTIDDFKDLRKVLGGRPC